MEPESSQKLIFKELTILYESKKRKDKKQHSEQNMNTLSIKLYYLDSWMLQLHVKNY